MRIFILALLMVVTGAAKAASLSTVITYQGELEFQGSAATGVFDFEFLLFDTDSGGTLLATLQVEDVTVTNGLFAIELDFGPGVFVGHDRWLQLGVRSGDSVGGFTGLLPRQRLTAAPYALHAEAVAADAVTSDEIADGAVDASDIGAGAVGAAAINPGEVQARISGSCPAGQAMVSVNADGTVACAPLPAGDITSIVTGVSSGLSGGCTSGDCNLVVDNSVVQSRVSGTCSSSQAIRAINDNGTVFCVNLPQGDITGISTTVNSGLDGGCSSGTCNLRVDATELFGSNAMSGSSTTASFLSPADSSAWFTLRSFTLSPGNVDSGEALLFANASVQCTNCFTNNSFVTCEMGFTTSSTGTPSTAGVSRVIVGRDGDSILRGSISNVENISVPAGTPTTFYLRGRSITGATQRCNFSYINAAGIFQPK